jgi:hypothetical protein
VDRQAEPAALDQHVCQHPPTDEPDRHVERDDGVTQSISGGDKLIGMIWSESNNVGAYAVIVTQIRQFAELSHPWRGSTIHTASATPARPAARGRFHAPASRGTARRRDRRPDARRATAPAVQLRAVSTDKLPPQQSIR